MTPPRSAFGAPPQGGVASGPAEPDPRRPLGSGRWTAVLLCVLVITVGIPVLNLVVPVDNAFHLSDFYVSLLGKILCYAIAALAIDLIWGYTGIISLGHGLFFALGGYAMEIGRAHV